MSFLTPSSLTLQSLHRRVYIYMRTQIYAKADTGWRFLISLRNSKCTGSIFSNDTDMPPLTLL